MQHSSETPSDLTAWLREQIDEDERVAQAADKRHPGAWVDSGSGDLSSRGSSSGGKIAIEGVGWVWSQPAARHIVHNDPARALREIETKRLIIDEHGPTGSWPPGRELCVTCDTIPGGRVPWPCRTLCLLALPYVDRPGYREEWRP